MFHLNSEDIALPKGTLKVYGLKDSVTQNDLSCLFLQTILNYILGESSLESLEPYLHFFQNYLPVGYCQFWSYHPVSLYENVGSGTAVVSMFEMIL
ncbi:hypothetical protein B7P43_G07225 [Cryptotermes secundus]|uniref:Uncharacterized protein n=1 Tax=Cryptotermes secundus TaxID=105785 RepID=A0A2J7QZ56_9NEOP|nr:hypothetical protein B7P43_G07225 [Cryptotermes secundus]